MPRNNNFHEVGGFFEPILLLLLSILTRAGRYVYVDLRLSIDLSKAVGNLVALFSPGINYVQY